MSAIAVCGRNDCLSELRRFRGHRHADCLGDGCTGVVEKGLLCLKASDMCFGAPRTRAALRVDMQHRLRAARPQAVPAAAKSTLKETCPPGRSHRRHCNMQAGRSMQLTTHLCVQQEETDILSDSVRIRIAQAGLTEGIQG